MLLNTDVATALSTHAQRVHACLQQCTQCTQCAHTCFVFPFVFRRRRQLRLHPVFLRRFHHRLAPQQARPSAPPSLSPNFLRSTIRLTSEDESPVGRTAPMLTLDLCPTAAASEELAAFAKRVEGELYDLFAAEASHTRHTDSFFWTSQAAETHKTGAPATLYEVRARAHLIDARSSCTYTYARRYSDALAFTASDEGEAACAQRPPPPCFRLFLDRGQRRAHRRRQRVLRPVAAALVRVQMALKGE